MRRREHVGRVNVDATETSVGPRDDDRPRTHARRRGRIARVHGRRRARRHRRREHVERGVDDTVGRAYALDVGPKRHLWRRRDGSRRSIRRGDGCRCRDCGRERAHIGGPKNV